MQRYTLWLILLILSLEARASRDPIEGDSLIERSVASSLSYSDGPKVKLNQIATGQNPYTYVWNDPINYIDPNGLWGIQFGNFNLGVGDPSLHFNTRSFFDAKQGAYAFADGVIPIWNPLGENFGLYDPCDKTLQKSQFIGGLTRDAVMLIGGGGPAGAVLKSQGIQLSIGQRVFLSEFGPGWASSLIQSQRLSQAVEIGETTLRLGGQVNTVIEGYKLFQ